MTTSPDDLLGLEVDRTDADPGEAAIVEDAFSKVLVIDGRGPHGVDLVLDLDSDIGRATNGHYPVIPAQPRELCPAR